MHRAVALLAPAVQGLGTLRPCDHRLASDEALVCNGLARLWRLEFCVPISSCCRVQEIQMTTLTFDHPLPLLGRVHGLQSDHRL